MLIDKVNAEFGEGVSKWVMTTGTKTTEGNWWSSYDARQLIDQFFGWVDIRIALL